MRNSKLSFLILFVAFVLPVCIFIFLKLFGKNEFAVKPLYQDKAPNTVGCAPVIMPYQVPDTVLSYLNFGTDSLMLVLFKTVGKDEVKQLARLKEEVPGVQLNVRTLEGEKFTSWYKCIFFLREPYNLLLLDVKGKIRGEYDTNDREEMDRLITEVAIITKQY